MSADRYASLQDGAGARARAGAKRRPASPPSDLGLIEVNEAFAAVSLHATRMLGLDEEIVNGTGAPSPSVIPSAQAARLVLTLAMEMRRRAVELGAVAICGGGGQGDALGAAGPLSHARTAVEHEAGHLRPERPGTPPRPVGPLGVSVLGGREPVQPVHEHRPVGARALVRCC